ncbi:MAG: ribonuclease HI [Phoenicibacter congonensis]|uniref:Ribonuclease H n=1 Tax=Phoenicibacter congonensis TaxID=1944646 RepID=A0AA43RI45_9ACTN|nr:ribonuclease HI [Phoenicibacter congonensis]
MKKVIAYSDGSSLGNPGPGGYGAILQYTDSEGVLHEAELSRGYKSTTNNRMELMGVVAILEALKQPCEVSITTDSQYVVNAFEKHWIESWMAKGWKKADKKPVLNSDLWKRLVELRKKHKVEFKWIKGHAGYEMNERCDQLAKAAASSGNLLDDNGYSEKQGLF